MELERVSEDDLRAKLSDRAWRLSHLYWIRDKKGRKVRFTPNPATAIAAILKRLTPSCIT